MLWVKEDWLSPLLAGFGGLLIGSCSTSSGFMGKLAPSLAQGAVNRTSFLWQILVSVTLELGLWLNQWFSNLSMQKNDLEGV